jgi:ArsR family transcriptional regulator, arsenate/arsenite/antimonite-responsive transcriptional repressor
MAKENGFKPELFFAALADRTRLRLLNLMRDGEVCVCNFADTLETNDPKISRHLAYLKRAGLVNGRRDGKWTHYSLKAPKDEAVRDVFIATLKMLKADRNMEQDRRRLTKVCCVTDSPVTIGSRQKSAANIR